MLSAQKILARSKDYKLLLIGQVITLLNNLVVYEIFCRFPFPGYDKVFVALMGITSLAMNVIAYTLLKDLTDNKLIRRSVLTFLFIGIISALVTGIISPGSSIYPYLRHLTILSISSVFLGFCAVLYLMIYDIFNEKHDIIYRLWGAACIYLLIGVLFSTVYFFIDVFSPGEFGLNTVPGPLHFVKCFTFSFYTLAGIDQPFQELSLLIKNISVIQAVFSNLYIMLLVGRLLSK